MSNRMIQQEKNCLVKSKGTVRNLTQRFKQLKLNQGQELQQNQDRFKPLKSTFFMSNLSNPLQNQNTGSYSGLSSPNETEKVNDNGRLLPMTTKASSNDDSIEYGKKFLPPAWVDIYEEIERLLEEIQSKMVELKKNQSKRLKVNFNTDEEIEDENQQLIQSTTDEITNLVKQAELRLKEIIKYQPDDKADMQIKNNIQIQLADRLKKVTMELKRNEKEHFLKVQDLHGEDIISSKMVQGEFINGNSELDLLQEDEQQMSTYRSSEISNLVKTIKDLAVLFQDLSQLVIEQGTILDRIDYNVEQAQKDVKQGVVHLEKTKNIEKSVRAKGCIMCLMVSILVLLAVFLLKHS